ARAGRIACAAGALGPAAPGMTAPTGPATPRPAGYPADMPDQFGAAERIAARRGITRADVDALALASQEHAARAQTEGRFEREIVPVEGPVRGEDGEPTGETSVVDRDQGLRDTSLDALAKLKPVMEDGIHTA